MQALTVPGARLLGVGALLGFLLAIIGGASATTWQQTNLALDNMQNRAAAVAPSMPERVYVAPKSLGVLRTDDRGLTWTAVSNGLPAGATFDALAVAPSDPAWVYTGHDVFGSPARVYRSTDAGANWVERSSGLDGGFVHALLVNATNPNTVLAALSGGNQPGVYRSLDGGANWTFVSGDLGSLSAYSLAASPGSPSTLLAGTVDGAARSVDLGSTWTTGTNPGAQFSRISWCAADPTQVYALDPSPDAIFRSTDAGVSFTGVSVPADPQLHLTSLAVSLVNPLKLISAGSGYGCGPFGPGSEKVWRSGDGGASWSEVLVVPACGGGGATDVMFDPLSTANVYLVESGPRNRGFRHSTDGGTTWALRIAGVENYAIDFARGAPGAVNYARSGPHLYRSAGAVGTWTDQGNAPGFDNHYPWGFETNFLDPDLLHEHGDAQSGDIAFSYLNRSTNAGVSWDPGYEYPPGFPSIGGIVDEVVTNHGDGQVVYARTLFGLYRSDNAGLSYALASAVPDARFGYEIRPPRTVVDATDSLRVFLAGLPDLVMLSEDGGVTFVPRIGDLPTPGGALGAVALFMRAADPDDLLLVLSDGRVFETEDGGVQWSLRGLLDLLGASILDATWDPASRHAFAVTDDGRVVSTHPTADLTGLPTTQLTTIHYSSTQQLLFVGTRSAGLFHTPISPPVGAPERPRPVDRPTSLFVEPNPFASETSVRFVVPDAGGSVRLSVYDAGGRLVRRLSEGSLSPGPRNLTWNGRDAKGRTLPTGVYFVRLRIDDRVMTAKAVLMR